MSEREPTELERAVARAIGEAFTEVWDAAADLDEENLIPAARAAIAEVFRHRHTDSSVSCPLCGFVVRKVEELPFDIEDEP
jgi:hypothetical protein